MLVQVEVNIGSSEVKKAAFKWNVTNLKGEFVDKLKDKWNNLPTEAPFFHKLRHITRLYRQFSKQKAKEHKRKELNTKAKLEVATAILHEDIYNEEVQGEVNQYQRKMEDIETRKAIGATIRSRVKWQKVGDKCTT